MLSAGKNPQNTRCHMHHQRTGKLEAYMTLLSSDSELKNSGYSYCEAIAGMLLKNCSFPFDRLKDLSTPD